MIYLSSFKLSDRSIKNPNIYLYNVFNRKDIDPFIFAPITVLYGNNGSGKSTILNIIANKLMLTDRKSTRLNSSHTDSSRMPSSASFCECPFFI